MADCQIPENNQKLLSVAKGIASVKPEYVVAETVRSLDLSYVSDKTKEKLKRSLTTDELNSTEPVRQKIKGQNKVRPHMVSAPRKSKMCFKFLRGNTCPHGAEKCCYSHDAEAFLASKPPDLDGTCYLYETYGTCRYGISCRFARSHLSDKNENMTKPSHVTGVVDQKEQNVLTKDTQIMLRKREFDFGASDAILKRISSGEYCQQKYLDVLRRAHNAIKANVDGVEEANGKGNNDVTLEEGIDTHIVPTDDVDEKIKIRPIERKRVGNLPFRRICKELGADITCGEMAMAQHLLQGQQSEWALLRRHPSEDIFGVQVCGGHADVMTRCAQLLRNACNVDFVDINMGCPIDFIYKKGAGAGLMGRLRKVDEIVYGMSEVLQEIPLTLKMRSGIQESRQIAHTICAELTGWKDRLNLITLHGRSREQRYTRLADWPYIGRCGKVLRDAYTPQGLLQSNDFPEAPRFYGSGDVLSFEDYERCVEEQNVDGVLIARGALIKPWLFTEIKERRHWDISSSERFDLLKKYVHYGLDHWGSDTEGVERTRRFLLEWLSFLYRYIPVGLLERVPQRINERPPLFRGRDDLETLFASASCADWIKISEMLLGPVSDKFVFLPKHKANAYSIQ